MDDWRTVIGAIFTLAVIAIGILAILVERDRGR
jgi:hypothetical protein